MSDLREDGWYWLRHASGDVVANLCEGVFVSFDGDFHGDDEEIEVLSRIPTPDEPWQMVPMEATPRMTRMMCLSSEPEAVEWDGEGLPPVGCECEFEYAEAGTWVDAKVIGHDGPAAVVAIDGAGYTGSACCADFRPIRSEEDRVVGAMLEVIHGNGHLSETGARALYRAGYRKG